MNAHLPIKTLGSARTRVEQISYDGLLQRAVIHKGYCSLGQSTMVNKDPDTSVSGERNTIGLWDATSRHDEANLLGMCSLDRLLLHSLTWDPTLKDAT